MKIKERHGDRTLVSLRGKFVVQPGRAGIPHIQSWPRKRGPHKDPAQKERVNWFTKVIKHCQRMDPLERAAAEEWSRNTPYTWRDLAVMAAYGRLVTVSFEDGSYATGIRMPDTQIQRLLRQLGTQQGAMYVIDKGEPVLLPPGILGDVMVWDADTDLPAWVPSSDIAGGVGERYLGSMAGTRSGSYAFQGSSVIINRDCSVSRIGAAVNANAGDTYSLFLLTLSGSTISAIHFQSPEITIDTSGDQWLTADLDTSQVFALGDTPSVGCVITSGTGSTRCHSKVLGTSYPATFADAGGTRFWYGNNAPAEGDTVKGTTSGGNAIALFEG